MGKEDRKKSAIELSTLILEEIQRCTSFSLILKV